MPMVACLDMALNLPLHSRMRSRARQSPSGTACAVTNRKTAEEKKSAADPVRRHDDDHMRSRAAADLPRRRRKATDVSSIVMARAIAAPPAGVKTRAAVE